MSRTAGAAPCRSRSWDRLHVIERSGPDWISALLELGGELEQPAFLLPTQDQLVSDISVRREELARWYRFVLPTDQTVQTFLDKTLFWPWAKQVGLPLPDSRVVRTESELREAVREMRYPLILKPLYRTAAWQRHSPVDKALRLDRPADLDRVGFDLFSAAPAMILSEWIEGPDSAVHYCLAYCERPGVMSAWYTGRKLLQYPRQTGSTAICVGTDNGEVREIAEETFRHAAFEGIGSVEVKYGVDGRPYITEPTVGRPNLQSYSAVVAGYNIHAVAMTHALGLERIVLPRAGNCWWAEENALLELAGSAGLRSVPWRLLGRELLRARRVGGAYWSWRDPRPAVALIGQKSGRLIRRLRGRSAQ